MSFLTDVFEGNWGNLGHDLTAHFKEDLPYYGLAAAGVTGGLGLAGMGPAAGLFGAEAAGAEAAGGSALGALPEAGGEALGFAGTPAADYGPASTAIDTALEGATPNNYVANEFGALNTTDMTPSNYVSSEFGATPQGGSSIVPTPDAGGLGGSGNLNARPDMSGGFDKAGGGSFLDRIVGGASKSITNNPLGIAAAGVGLGMNMFRGNPQDPNQQKIQQQADQLGEQGKMLQQYLANGTLPPAMQAQLNQATQAAKARIIANHAAKGLPTDPSQNSALAQELNSVDLNAVAAMGQAQIDMMKTGLSETGLSSQLYEMLVKMDKQNNTELMGAIANFASALGGGGGKGVTLNLGGATKAA